MKTEEIKNHIGSETFRFQESLIMVKLLFNTTSINKSLLSLQRQRCSSLFASKGLGVWN